MTIDWQHFTPWSSLAGGAVIGLAAALYVLLDGRIAGISGILGGLIGPAKLGAPAVRSERRGRLAFVAGLLLAVPLWRAVAALPTLTVSASAPSLVVAGLLVGVGTRYAQGCTSGHGVCGLSRGSPRSLAATLSFMAAGFVTVYLLRHAMGVDA